MEVVLMDFPILKDNDMSYFSMLEGVINSVDELSTMEVRRNIENFSFRISLSESIYIESLIKELNAFHNLIGIKVDFSKSMKTSSTLSYKISLEN